MSDTHKRFIIIHESVAQSWLRDASTFALFVGLIGIGWMIGSSAMQWTGAIVGFITVMARSNKYLKPMTRDEAIAFLNDTSGA